MKKFLHFAKFDFLPHSTDVGLLVLRIWLGCSLFLLHGLLKLQNFTDLSTTFPDPLGIGTQASLTLAVFAETACSILVVLGLFTRFAALNALITMTVAFIFVHKTALSGEHSGELAFLYLAGFVTLFITSGGRYALDTRLSHGEAHELKHAHV